MPLGHSLSFYRKCVFRWSVANFMQRSSSHAHNGPTVHSNHSTERTLQVSPHEYRRSHSLPASSLRSKKLTVTCAQNQYAHTVSVCSSLESVFHSCLTQGDHGNTTQHFLILSPYDNMHHSRLQRTRTSAIPVQDSNNPRKTQKRLTIVNVESD